MKTLRILFTAVCCLTICGEQPDLVAVVADSSDTTAGPTAPDSSGYIKGRYIPANLDECFVQLDTLLSVKDIDSIRALGSELETIVYHHGLGLWLRNNWCLWAGSRLVIWFQRRGIIHPDSMSAYILEQYWRHLNKVDVEYPRKPD